MSISIMVMASLIRYGQIATIRAAIQLDHNLEWYAVEENCIYVSCFYWNHGVQEEIYLLDDDFGTWVEARYEFEEGLADSDHIVWYYLLENKINWLDRATLLDLLVNFSL
ncbi:hypothetical protein HO543_09765 [Streptococcus suis]|nr:hypothetical protein [Streptococcus suis]NQJ77579.1 hypothetical protein [Streptococcus suis]